jgi:hypothetical protein
MPSIIVPIDLGSGRTGAVKVPQDVATYFGITTAATTETEITRSRKAHSRRTYKGLDDVTGTLVPVEASTWKSAPRSSSGRGAGREVKIPTKLTTAAGQTRMVTIRFPGNAVIGAINKWIHAKVDATKRPDYFIHEGTRYALVTPGAGDVNPGEDPTPAP